MKNGLYAVQFATPIGAGNGVVFLQDGILRGGDSMMYYLGNYKVDGEKFEATATTNAHAQVPGMASVFGRNNVHLTLKGQFVGQDANFLATAPEAPGISLNGHLKRIGA